MRRFAVILVVLFILTAGQAALSKTQFSDSGFDPSVLRIKEDEYLGRFVPDIKVQTIDSGDVSLRNLTERPLILLLIYYDCPNICPLLGEGLASSLENVKDLKIGRDYNVLVLSFNKSDTVEKALGFREKLKSRTRSSIEGWYFAIASEEDIKTVTSSTGYRVFKNEDNMFVHPNVYIFLSPKRKITRYIFGTRPDPFNVRLAILESVEGKIGKVPLPSLLTLACYKYDSETRGYMINIPFMFASVGLLMAMMTGILSFIVYRKRKNFRTNMGGAR
ncbi:MAG: SCO family protein [Thermodesulfovibrionales bacterium]